MQKRTEMMFSRSQTKIKKSKEQKPELAIRVNWMPSRKFKKNNWMMILKSKMFLRSHLRYQLRPVFQNSSCLRKYDRKTNTRYHLDNFHSIMLYQNVSGLILYQTFRSTLIGLAQKQHQTCPLSPFMTLRSWLMPSNDDSSPALLLKNYLLIYRK